jgi:hypothetical protein
MSRQAIYEALEIWRPQTSLLVKVFVADVYRNGSMKA